MGGCGRCGALGGTGPTRNDGLVSNLALIMGVAGAGVDREVILVAGIAGLLAGAFSMAAGEYASMRVQRELFGRLLHIEAHEIGTDPEGEATALGRFLGVTALGFQSGAWSLWGSRPLSLSSD